MRVQEVRRSAGLHVPDIILDLLSELQDAYEAVAISSTLASSRVRRWCLPKMSYSVRTCQKRDALDSTGPGEQTERRALGR